MPTRNGVGRAGGLLDESQTFTRMVSSDPPCRWGAERRATARGRARATAHGDDDDRHERGAHPRCGAKNSRQSVRGDERAGAGARGAVIARDDARWRRDFEIRARARDARSRAIDANTPPVMRTARLDGSESIRAARPRTRGRGARHRHPYPSRRHRAPHDADAARKVRGGASHDTD